MSMKPVCTAWDFLLSFRYWVADRLRGCKRKRRDQASAPLDQPWRRKVPTPVYGEHDLLLHPRLTLITERSTIRLVSLHETHFLVGIRQSVERSAIASRGEAVSSPPDRLEATATAHSRLVPAFAPSRCAHHSAGNPRDIESSQLNLLQAPGLTVQPVSPTSLISLGI
jgi:hypothetical protein